MWFALEGHTQNTKPNKMITMYSKNQVMPRALGSLLEDFFSNGINKVFGEEALAGTAHAPVNIQETDKNYELHLVAPGLKKEEFKINVDRNILTISFDHKEEETEETAKWLRNEYKMKSFKRSFTLNEKIDTSGITAKYTDGILNVSLPKKEQTEVSAQEISVS
jgi:HSP20 family protein